VIGTYHHMSEAHLARYTAEFDFATTPRRSRTLSAPTRPFAASRKRLTYRRTDKSPPDIKQPRKRIGERRKRYSEK
jgi:hypothetical protein